MTENEQIMVNRLKLLIARIIIDFDDEAVLEIVKKAANKEADND